MMPGTVLPIIEEQINVATADLLNYQPSELDWPARILHTSRKVIPWLESSAGGLKRYVEDVLNAPVMLRSLWTVIRDHVNLPKRQILAFDRQLEFDDILRESVTGEVVSKVVMKFLMDQNSDFRSNGRSDYPDLYLASSDYSNLPVFRRFRGEDQQYGAALKGAERRPVRVPDGIEIKTCRDAIRVDCHHPHAGLHLVLVFSESDRFFTVADVAVAFLRSNDYHEAGRNTTATTPKYSFNGERFVSLLKTEALA